MWHVLVKGGWMMLPLALCSIVAVTIIIDRLFFFRGLRAGNRAEEVIGLVRKGSLDEALRIAGGQEGEHVPVMKVLSAGLAYTFDPTGAMESAATAEVSAMKRGLVALDTIITLSPLLGLLGTIIGMISAFNIMATAGLGQPHAVTGGVAEALVCTAAGISVAVVSLVPYNYFLSRVEGETDVIENYATRLELAISASAREQQP
ncbi:MAG: MotA/TolQ/ExbB proton channel family protein [Syntrophorhabdales bacterium]|jgi:biopolymer transport protein ExbB